MINTPSEMGLMLAKPRLASTEVPLSEQSSNTWCAGGEMPTVPTCKLREESPAAMVVSFEAINKNLKSPNPIMPKQQEVAKRKRINKKLRPEDHSTDTSPPRPLSCSTYHSSKQTPPSKSLSNHQNSSPRT
ncbi:uncharacterized protein A4U43_C01F17040 [Asparagus officinalis]|uniref:Uncharacterized protein n=1 Tax=Asparagus officinalis TaxID=4686 RepID=A0A5P1FUN6_ASPOF|nr:uncharacterized protein A4U43_C01F17040 [Asparagus officinalis]